MKRFLHTLLLLCSLMVASPNGVMAEEIFEGPEQETSSITVQVMGSRVRVTGANGEMLQIYNLAGVCIASYDIDSADKTVNTIMTHGCYVVKVGTLVRKVRVR